MRKIILIAFVFSDLLLLSCSSTEYLVESDYSYEARFHKYKSFEFAENRSFTGSTEDRVLFEKYIGTVLSAWGYSQKQKRPDFYVFYSVYSDDLSFKGYNQPDLLDWSGSKRQDDYFQGNADTLIVDSIAVASYSKAKKHRDYQSVKFKLQEGTILISFYDRRRGKTVWQGYASGVFGPDKVRNERMLRSAITEIMDEFKLPTYSI